MKKVTKRTVAKKMSVNVAPSQTSKKEQASELFKDTMTDIKVNDYQGFSMTFSAGFKSKYINLTPNQLYSILVNIDAIKDCFNANAVRCQKIIKERNSQQREIKQEHRTVNNQGLILA